MKKHLWILLAVSIITGCWEESAKDTAVSVHPLIMPNSVVADELEQYIGMECNNAFIKVRIGFDNSINIPQSQYEVEYIDGKMLLNGKEPSEQDIQEHLATLEDERKAIVSAKIEKRQKYAKSLRDLQIVNDESILSEFVDGNDTFNFN